MPDIGPHLLGRVPSYPDDRDWTPDQLHALGLERASADAPAWVDPIQLDQGQTGHCVGFGWAGWGDATPVQDTFQNADGDAIYYECKVIDGEPLAEDGSNVRSGAKAMQNRGRLTAYAFATNTAQIDEWFNHGPVVFGSDWYHDMFTPDPAGTVHATGAIDGGHCYLGLDDLAPAEDAYLCQNSWGDWGPLHGRFKISKADMAMLLASGGEACLAAESPLPSPAPVPVPPVPPDPIPAPPPIPVPPNPPPPPPPQPAPAPSGCLLNAVVLVLVVTLGFVLPLLARMFG
jgi:hypothetical protein